MNFNPRLRTPIVCLVFLAALAIGPRAVAERLQTQGWEQWNLASTPIYPNKTWQQYASPEEAGWSSEGLALAKEESQLVGSAAVMVVYDGAVLAKWGQVERRFMCHSVRKSLLSALYGLAVSAGDIDLDETIGSIGIDDDAGLTAIEKSAKVSDLLKSRSGVYLPAAYEARSAEENRPERGSHRPGTHWYYNNWDFNALATIYNKKTGDDVFEAFQTSIADPLEMQDFELRHTYYHLESTKSRHPAYPFRMSARDLARFGLLFLNDGKWQDKQIISSQWVRKSTQAYSMASGQGYGYMWWTASGQVGEFGTYMALGYGGHAVVVVPRAKIVFVHRVDTYQKKSVDGASIRKILWQILSARTGPSRANPKLVPMPEPLQAEPGVVLAEAQLASLTGEYRREDFIATVNEIGGRLEAQGPRLGRYFLVPRTPTEFLVEDSEQRVDFELDDAGKAVAMHVWRTSGEVLKIPRVR